MVVVGRYVQGGQALLRVGGALGKNQLFFIPVVPMNERPFFPRRNITLPCSSNTRRKPGHLAYQKGTRDESKLGSTVNYLGEATSRQVCFTHQRRHSS